MRASQIPGCFFVIGCLVGVLSGTACTKKTAAPDSGPSATRSLPGPPAGSTLAIAGRFLDGADQTSIRAYLQSVVEVKPTRFQVQWSPDTVAVSREEAMKSLHSISEDGSDYIFASAEPVVGQLKPGRILWIWGIALRRVSSIGRLGGATLVSTVPVSLPEALTQADIAFDSPINFANSFVGMRAHEAKQASQPKNSRLARQSPLRHVMMSEDSAQPSDQPSDDYGVVAAADNGYTGRIAGFEYSLGYHVRPNHLTLELQARKEEEGSTEAAKNEIHSDQRSEFFEAVKEQREARHEMYSQFKKLMAMREELKNLPDPAGHGWDQPVADNVEGSDIGKASIEALAALHVKDLEPFIEKYHKAAEKAEQAERRKKSLAAAGALAKQVFSIVSDNLDVRFRTKMDLDQVALASAMKIKDGRISEAAASFKNIGGHIELELIGRMGQPGTGNISIPVAHVPLQMTIPVPVYGIPFVFQVATDFLVKLSLSGANATHHFSGSFDFNGGSGVQADAAKTETPGKIETSEPKVEEATALSPGVSASVIGIQMPRLGLGLGLFGAAGMAYLDLVNVLTTTNSAAVTTMLGPPCTRYTLDTSAHVGVDVTIMPIPIPLVESIVSSALSQKKEIGHHKWKRINPAIKMCEIVAGESA